MNSDKKENFVITQLVKYFGKFNWVGTVCQPQQGPS